MQKHNHIKALFFLGVFSLMILHNIIPHSHHQHEANHSHKAVLHSDNHNDPLENENVQEGFLELFLELHEHSLSSNKTVVTQESSVKQLKVKKDVKTSISLNRYSISINYDDEAEKIKDYHPPTIYFNPYLSHLNSRGPPSLG